MCALYWQAELYQHGELYDIDFPRRENKDEAIEDARDRLMTLSDRERRTITAGVSEWRGTDDSAESTGLREDVT